jgi:DNA-binding CsgD family transcriptional regulator
VDHGRHSISEGTPAPHRGAFVGRDRELTRLLALVEGGERCLITVTGRGGVGKTRLALEAAASVAATGHRDVVVVPLSSVVDPHVVLDEIADALGVRVSQDSTSDAVARRLQRTATLLVLDNAEHVVAAGPAVNELAGRCPTLTVLVTSQTRLGVAGERVLPLAPLSVPGDDVTEPRVVSSSPAVELYLLRAGAVSDQADGDLVAVGELCRRLEGLPLAIELAAARARTLRAADVLALLDGVPLDALRCGARDAPARHHDLRSAIACTDALLGDDERALLRHLAVVPAPFDLDVAVAVHGDRPAADVVDALSTLVDFHLVDPLGDGWFAMPATIRAYGAEDPDAAARDGAIDRFVGWCARGAARPGPRSEALLRGGLRLAIESGRSLEAHRLVDVLGRIWERTRRRREHHDLIEAALAMDAVDVPPAVRARALLWSAALAPRSATSVERELLARRIAEAHEVALAGGDDELLLRAVNARLLATAALGPVDDLAAAIAEARAAAERRGDRRWIARCDLWASHDAQQRGDAAASIHHARAALLAARELRDDRILAHASVLLAPVRDLRPELAADVPTLEEMLEPVRRAGLADFEGFLLPMLVDDAVHAGNVDKAVRWCTDGLELAADAPAAVVAIVNLLVAVYVAQALRDDAFAARLYGAIKDDVAGLVAVLQPFRATRHDDAVERLRASLGPRFDEYARAGAALSRRDAVEQALSFLSRHPRPARRRPRAASSRLTPRERDVLDLLAGGMTNKEIGRHLSLTPKTVMHHTTAIYRKLGLRGRSEAAVWAIHNDATRGQAASAHEAATAGW